MRAQVSGSGPASTALRLMTISNCPAYGKAGSNPMKGSNVELARPDPDSAMPSTFTTAMFAPASMVSRIFGVRWHHVAQITGYGELRMLVVRALEEQRLRGT